MKDDIEVFDLSKITKEEILLSLVDYKTQEPIGFTTFTHDINEEVKSTIPLDIVKNNMLIKYHWQDWQFKIITIANKIELAVLVPNISDNVKIVENDMKNNGYFKGFERNYTIYNHSFKELRFEPMFQENVRNTAINMGLIFHATHKNNVNSIMEKGIIPSSKNTKFDYPNRVYFSKYTNNVREICKITEELANASGRNVDDYVILTINTNKIPDNVSFFMCPIYENGIFTNEVIPSSCIVSVKTFKEVANFCCYNT